jgi:hypothetical protein
MTPCLPATPPFDELHTMLCTKGRWEVGVLGSIESGRPLLSYGVWDRMVVEDSHSLEDVSNESVLRMADRS